MFSSKMLIALFYIFGSVIHFELIFVYGIRKESNFILLHVDIQFSQRHLLKRLSFPLNGLGTLVKNHLTMYTRVYFRLSVLFHWSMFVFMLILYHFDWFFKIFGCAGSLLLHVGFL